MEAEEVEVKKLCNILNTLLLIILYARVILLLLDVDECMISFSFESSPTTNVCHAWTSVREQNRATYEGQSGLTIFFSILILFVKTVLNGKSQKRNSGIKIRWTYFS